MSKQQDIAVGIVMLLAFIVAGVFAIHNTRGNNTPPASGASSSYDQPTPEPTPVGCPHGDCKG